MSENMIPLTIFLLSLLGAGLGAYFGAYFREKGKNLATKEDIALIVRKTEEIKAEVNAGAWLGQKRWERKWECYAEMVRSLGEIHTLIHESLSLDPDSRDYAHQHEERKRGVTEAFQKFRQFGSIARIAVGPNARTVLTRLGDEWNKSLVAAEHLGIVARWGWLVITDIARADLFGEPREMPDEFTGDVDVPKP